MKVIEFVKAHSGIKIVLLYYSTIILLPLQENILFLLPLPDIITFQKKTKGSIQSTSR